MHGPIERSPAHRLPVGCRRKGRCGEHRRRRRLSIRRTDKTLGKSERSQSHVVRKQGFFVDEHGLHAFCAEKELDGDIIIAYSDIVYEPKILQTLVDCSADRTTIVDSAWRELWEKRMANPLDDAETMKIDSSGHVLELGKKPTGYHEIQGQYIGLTKISAGAIDEMVRFYHGLDRSAFYDGKNFDNMFMTSFLQRMINHGMPIKAAMITGGWFDVDSSEDLEYYSQMDFRIG